MIKTIIFKESQEAFDVDVLVSELSKAIKVQHVSRSADLPLYMECGVELGCITLEMSSLETIFLTHGETEHEFVLFKAIDDIFENELMLTDADYSFLYPIRIMASREDLDKVRLSGIYLGEEIFHAKH